MNQILGKQDQERRKRGTGNDVEKSICRESAYHATEEDVRSLFADYSPSDVRVIHDKGFGFVEVSEDVADDAIAALNGVDFRAGV